MTANCTRFCASHSVFAPRSSMMHVGFAERRKQSSKRRPVDARHRPQARASTSPSARRYCRRTAPHRLFCSFTALIDMPIEVVRARRIAWLGFSLGAIASGEWTTSTPDPRFGVRLELHFDLLVIAVADEMERRVASQSARCARDHRRRTAIAAHGVDRYARAPGMRAARGLGLGRNDFAAVIVAARRA